MQIFQILGPPLSLTKSKTLNQKSKNTKIIFFSVIKSKILNKKTKIPKIPLLISSEVENHKLIS